MAPPMPPTTPPIIFLLEVLRPPALLPLLPPSFNEGRTVAVANPVVDATTFSVGTAVVKELPSMTVTMVVV
jgi:hypothetical protein